MREPARLLATGMAALLAAAACWALAPAPSHAQRAAADTVRGSHMLLAPHASGSDSEIDRAIARQSRKHTSKQSGTRAGRGAADDAIYRFEPRHASPRRIMI